MKIAKVFRSGNSQAVRIPKAFRIECEEVEIEKTGDTLVLRHKKATWDSLVKSLSRFSPDFLRTGRKQPRIQRRGKTFA